MRTRSEWFLGGCGGSLELNSELSLCPPNMGSTNMGDRGNYTNNGSTSIRPGICSC